MKYTLLLSFSLLSVVLFGQIPEYYVYMIKGEVNQKRERSAPVKMQQKQLVYITDIITVSKNAEVTLVNKEQQKLVLATPGSYKVKELDKKLHVSSSGITKKYLYILWHELLDPNYDYSKLKKDNIAGTWGGVSRSDDCNNLLFPVNGFKTSADSLFFRWRRTSAGNIYSLLLYDAGGRELFNKKINDSLTVLSATHDLKVQGRYYWLIKGEQPTCEDELPLYFEWMNKQEESKLVAALTGDTGTADMNSYFESVDKLEKNGLIYAAADYLRTLLKKNPADHTLLKSCVSFLLEYGMEQEASLVWENYKPGSGAKQ